FRFFFIIIIVKRNYISKIQIDDIMPTIKEAQIMVRNLEREKGFSNAISDKIIWMTEELGELCHAYKHNDREKMAEEAVDVFFFVASILEKLDVDGDKIFEMKLKKNKNRIAISNGQEQHFDSK
ncbi:MazG nucleotide pyrophosphohydrolase domain-containing protein, partial [Thermoproteota archaeon]